eukprot:91808-Prorocentrum_minimum.AAC.1
MSRTTQRGPLLPVLGVRIGAAARAARPCGRRWRRAFRARVQFGMTALDRPTICVLLHPSYRTN